MTDKATLRALRPSTRAVHAAMSDTRKLLCTANASMDSPLYREVPGTVDPTCATCLRMLNKPKPAW